MRALVKFISCLMAGVQLIMASERAANDQMHVTNENMDQIVLCRVKTLWRNWTRECTCRQIKKTLRSSRVNLDRF